MRMAVKPHQAFFWLHQHDRQNYQRWNELVAGFKSADLNPPRPRLAHHAPEVTSRSRAASGTNPDDH